MSGWLNGLAELQRITNEKAQKRDKLTSILNANKGKNFVKRIIDRDKYPVLDNGDGTHSTHSMAWGEVDGRYVVFPTVQQEGEGLVRFGDSEAFGRSMRNGEYIEFADPAEAEWFSHDYKSVWGDR